ncbi:hypothetical protein [Dactylosporangium darangshiense]|uniref:Uncharacterized protein n=1 Tax=Dactylosporangium darangshiense TaxID=579108 RepID=A0ABP8DAQ3_9ACTN
MECTFSEFSYGYAAIREAESELARVYRASGAPALPSLVAEEELGWDAKLPFVEYALFLQFKRVHYVSRRHPASQTWPYVDGRHYRFAIDTNGHQHHALLDLEARLLSGAEVGEVYYAAPTFHEDHEFDTYYSNGEVLDRSSLVSPSEFGANTGIHHFVTDEAGTSQVLSSPRPPRRQTTWERLVAETEVRARVAADRRPRARISLGLLEEALMSSAATLGRGFSRALDAPAARRIQRLAALLDCGLVLLVSSENQ